ncbi:MAG: 3-hydroxybutyrate dehydrogenase [Alphaproteobacteria bacterium]|jgi:3-hydroxybutyrate dehydrogenase|nr:3-hydroxybutyrate dehydrogenase [Alphaproteobacteria bacterium]
MLKDKVAVVTGSTSGIGLGIARALATAGADVMLNGFGDAAEIEEIRRQMAAAHDVRVAYSGADLSTAAGVRGLIEATDAELGRVDVLVNNAGIQHTDAVQDFPDEKWDAIIALNQSAVFHGIKAAIPQMYARDWGRIINVASAHGLVASPKKAAYVAAKHAIVGLTKVVALESAQTGVTCNAICPGWVLTPLVEAQIKARAEEKGTSFDDEANELLAEKQPSRRFVTPEQLGDLAVFLCSPGGEEIRGQAFAMDGGWTAQ